MTAVSSTAQAGRTPLHLLCTNGSVTGELIAALLPLEPKAAKIKSNVRAPALSPNHFIETRPLDRLATRSPFSSSAGVTPTSEPPSCATSPSWSTPLSGNSSCNCARTATTSPRDPQS